jgi:predicted alpha-1,2-mannosidase
MKIYRTILLLLASIATAVTSAQEKGDLASFVNPFIGTGGHGHTYPGATCPFGMVQLSPDTRLDGWDGCSAYHASDTIIYGFSHTHLSGTGCSDYGDILLMPVAGKVTPGNYGYASPFRHESEKASPGNYSVILEKYGIVADLTATPRTGFLRFTFPGTGDAGIVVDLEHRDKVLESGLTIVNDHEIEGFRVSEAWAKKQIVYFVARFSQPFSGYAVSKGNELQPVVAEYSGQGIHGLFNFKTRAGEQILVKVGISAVSAEGARKNLDSENPGWDFNGISSAARAMWNKELGKITVEGGTHDQQVNFYTALYHVMLSPNLYMDVDGKYRGRDLKVHTAEGFSYYTVFSLWDTYRAANPLYTIIERKRTSDFINTFIRQYEEGGLLPVWELSGNETGCMIGYHAVPVIADAFMKGIRGYDAEKAFEAMKKSAMEDHLGLKYYKAMGYIPADKEGESVSKTLEYAYDDWAIAQVAKALEKETDYGTFIRRAQYYKNLYDPGTGFMRAKQNAAWVTPFDPYEVNFNYTEANAWQYSFYVPQDIDGLAKLMGGMDKFGKKLDDLFAANTSTTGRDQADISGLIGQYAHGNEPSHHMAYLYDYAGEPWKTQELIHRICRDFYNNSRDGLIGNEDCGQMSAWYVFSALGFYPVTPGSNQYAIGTPLFPKAVVHMEDGADFTIEAHNLSDKNFYIQSATLDGRPLNSCCLVQPALQSGGKLIFTMGPAPARTWGSAPGNRPVSAITEDLIQPVPAVATGSATFMDSTVVSLSSPLPGSEIRYALNGTPLSPKSNVYKNPVVISNTTALKAYSTGNGLPESFLIDATFTRIPKNRKITLNTAYAQQYTAGGDLALINFTRGGDNFRTGNWQGYEGNDLDAVIDLDDIQPVSSVTGSFFQDVDSWIFFPQYFDVSISSDGHTFKPAGRCMNEISEKDMTPGPHEFKVTLAKGTETRYIRVVAKNMGVCPYWHPGAGSKAWIFADEIIIEN